MITRLEKMQEFFKSLQLDFNIEEYAEENHRDLNDLYNHLCITGAFFKPDFSYNSAMNYLKDKDPTLLTSLGLAHKNNLSIRSISSSTLGTLLREHLNKIEFSKHEKNITTFFQLLNEEEQDQ